MWSRFKFFGIVICAFGFFVAGLANGQENVQLPRYLLPVGRKLKYSSLSQSSGTSPMRVNGTTEILVVGENADGSRRLVVRVGQSFTQIINGQTHSEPEEITVGWVDLYPDGRVAADTPVNMRIDPASFMPLLPADSKQWKDGWSFDNATRLSIADYSAQPASSGDFVFKSSESGVMSSLYQTTGETTFHFDRSKGVISGAEGESTQQYGIQSQDTTTLTLDSDETVPPEQAEQIGKEYAVFFKSADAYDAKLETIAQNPQDVDRILAEAKSILADADVTATRPEVKSRIQEMLQNHDAESQFEKQTAQQISGVLNKPAFDFETTDIDGKPVKLIDLRGKVVLLDFWYRGCGWCMYAMPQIKQIATDFKDQPVAVLGMNTDADEKNARLVIDIQQLNYPTLKAADLPAKFGVGGFPTLILIDQMGVVSRVHVGWSPTLREDIGAQIQSLLNQPPTAALGSN
ncbi:MAG: TlpA disulfide reductase family protein [Tepidisphaeraceae bacterium]|jgi:thiol-disulfide isomerase/thioredoxin